MNRSSQAQFHCPGCHRRFSPRGLSQHITKSQRPTCRALQTNPAFLSSRPNLLSSTILLTRGHQILLMPKTPHTPLTYVRQV